MERICVVTPSFNQARFLGRTMRSVLDHCQPDRLDYVVMDGGSTDGSVDIIRSFEGRLHHWQSARDGGQYQAIAEGFGKSDASILAWLNADDLYLPWTLKSVLKIFDDVPEVEWITTRFAVAINAEDLPIYGDFHSGVDREGFSQGDCFPWGHIFSGPFIQQESTFWRRRLWDAAGGCFAADLKLAGDFELWHRFLQISEPAMAEFPLGLYRFHGDNRAHILKDTYTREVLSVLDRIAAPQPQGPERALKRQINKRIRATGLPLDVFPEFAAPMRRRIIWRHDTGSYDLHEG